jgi:hypothetical protein
VIDDANRSDVRMPRPTLEAITATVVLPDIDTTPETAVTTPVSG